MDSKGVLCRLKINFELHRLEVEHVVFDGPSKEEYVADRWYASEELFEAGGSALFILFAKRLCCGSDKEYGDA